MLLEAGLEVHMFALGFKDNWSVDICGWTGCWKGHWQTDRLDRPSSHRGWLGSGVKSTPSGFCRVATLLISHIFQYLHILWTGIKKNPGLMDQYFITLLGFAWGWRFGVDQDYHNHHHHHHQQQQQHQHRPQDHWDSGRTGLAAIFF